MRHLGFLSGSRQARATLVHDELMADRFVVEKIGDHTGRIKVEGSLRHLHVDVKAKRGDSDPATLEDQLANLNTGSYVHLFRGSIVWSNYSGATEFHIEDDENFGGVYVGMRIADRLYWLGTQEDGLMLTTDKDTNARWMALPSKGTDI